MQAMQKNTHGSLRVHQGLGYTKPLMNPLNQDSYTVSPVIIQYIYADCMPATTRYSTTKCPRRFCFQQSGCEALQNGFSFP